VLPIPSRWRGAAVSGAGSVVAVVSAGVSLPEEEGAAPAVSAGAAVFVVVVWLPPQPDKTRITQRRHAKKRMWFPDVIFVLSFTRYSIRRVADLQ